MSIQKVLLLPHLKVHNANALSSPFTVGFPAITGFMGAAHALQRKLNEMGFAVTFSGVGIVSHDANLQTYKGDNDFVHSIVGTGNPLDKTGERSAFIEEARIHLDISLIIEIQGLQLEQHETLLQAVEHILAGQLKIASGDLLGHQSAQITLIDNTEPDSFSALQRYLMPGYALIERRDLMIDAMSSSQEEHDALDILIDYLAVHHRCDVSQDSEGKETIQWQRGRKTSGWIIPVATGFQGISELGLAKNQRDSDTPHRFAESVVTLAEFKMPHRISSLNKLLWRYQYDEDKSLYLCTQERSDKLSTPAREENEFA